MWYGSRAVPRERQIQCPAVHEPREKALSVARKCLRDGRTIFPGIRLVSVQDWRIWERVNRLMDGHWNLWWVMRLCEDNCYLMLAALSPRWDEPMGSMMGDIM